MQLGRHTNLKSWVFEGSIPSKGTKHKNFKQTSEFGTVFVE